MGAASSIAEDRYRPVKEVPSDVDRRDHGILI
jgi:hypothetical protein